MAQTGKQAFAARASLLLNAQSRRRQLLTALVLLALVAALGGALAQHAAQMRARVSSSILLERLTPSSEKNRVAQLLADPQSSELLMRYIDAMGAAVHDMELPPQWDVRQFFQLLDAAQQAQARLTGFVYDSAAQRLRVGCRGGDGALMASALEQAGGFAAVEAIGWQDGAEEFTISCQFA